jgi:hypothetical protein
MTEQRMLTDPLNGGDDAVDEDFGGSEFGCRNE